MNWQECYERTGGTYELRRSLQDIPGESHEQRQARLTTAREDWQKWASANLTCGSYRMS